MVRIARAFAIAALLATAAEAHRRNGAAHDYTVGHELQVNAGTAYPLRSNVEVLLQLPLYQRVNGIQLTSQRNVISGAQWRF